MFPKEAVVPELLLLLLLGQALPWPPLPPEAETAEALEVEVETASRGSPEPGKHKIKR